MKRKEQTVCWCGLEIDEQYSEQVAGKSYCDRCYVFMTAARAFAADFPSPWALYRAIYKATPCGPTLGIEIPLEEIWKFNSDLPQIWVPIRRMSISSIVEGFDGDGTRRYIIDCTGKKPSDVEASLWHDLELVSAEAEAIQNELRKKKEAENVERTDRSASKGAHKRGRR